MHQVGVAYYNGKGLGTCYTLLTRVRLTYLYELSRVL